MAAYLNRTLSMVTGNNNASANNNNMNSSTSAMDTANALTDSIQRGLHHSGIDSSPLQIFVRAKKKINDIFSEIEDYVIETTRFIDGREGLTDSLRAPQSHPLTLLQICPTKSK